MLLPFENIRPDNGDFTCIFWTKSHQRCRNRINQTDRNCASALRTRLLTFYTEDENRAENFVRYITLCSCRATHRQRVDMKSIFIQSSINQWKQELFSGKGTSLKENSDEKELPRTKPSPQVTKEREQNLPAKLEGTNFEPIACRTRNHLHNEQLACNKNLQSSEFEPYKTSLVKSLADAVRRPLLVSEMPSGAIYIFTGPLRPLDPIHMVKVGHTTITVEERMKGWSRCGHKPNVEFQLKDIPHAKRVEALVQMELWKKRRRRRYCHNFPICITEHKEWFEIDVALAEASVSKWAAWMKESDPYDEHGELKSVWTKNKIQALIEGRFVSGKPEMSKVNFSASAMQTTLPTEKHIEVANLVSSLAAGLLQLQGLRSLNLEFSDKVQCARELLATVVESRGAFVERATDVENIQSTVSPSMIVTVC